MDLSLIRHKYFPLFDTKILTLKKDVHFLCVFNFTSNERSAFPVSNNLQVVLKLFSDSQVKGSCRFRYEIPQHNSPLMEPEIFIY